LPKKKNSSETISFFLGSVFFVFSIFNELEELYKAKKKKAMCKILGRSCFPQMMLLLSFVKPICRLFAAINRLQLGAVRQRRELLKKQTTFVSLFFCA
jgi:hypothetical protein